MYGKYVDFFFAGDNLERHIGGEAREKVGSIYPLILAIHFSAACRLLDAYSNSTRHPE